MAEQSITKTSTVFLRLNHVVPLLVDAKTLKLIMHKSLHNVLNFAYDKLNGWITNWPVYKAPALYKLQHTDSFQIQLQNTFVCK